MKIAIIGGGVAGLGAAWLLNRAHDVTVFEAAGYPGGHSNTVEVDYAGRRIPVDTGFIVYNERNYPNLSRLFAALGVPTQRSDMSFAVSADGGRYEYAGDLRGFLAQPTNAFRPRLWRMIRDIHRFYTEAPTLRHDPVSTEKTIGEYLAGQGYSDAFVFDHLLPMAAAIWSSTVRDIFNFPLATFLRFFENHGLLQLRNRPEWRTVSGGSREYVRRLTKDFSHRIRLNAPVLSVDPSAHGILVRAAGAESERFDQVIMATHADRSLAILGRHASPEERKVLSAFRYERNRAVLHCDPALMPRRRGVWASWNYISAGSVSDERQVAITYWMNRLQNIDRRNPLFVSLNPIVEPHPASVFESFDYDHPLFDRAAIAAQADLPKIQGRRGLWFCGAYCGYGFHEDGFSSGLAIAEALGAPAPWAESIVPVSPAAYIVRDYAPAHVAAAA